MLIKSDYLVNTNNQKEPSKPINQKLPLLSVLYVLYSSLQRSIYLEEGCARKTSVNIFSKNFPAAIGSDWHIIRPVHFVETTGLAPHPPQSTSARSTSFPAAPMFVPWTMNPASSSATIGATCEAGQAATRSRTCSRPGEEVEANSKACLV